MSASVVSSSYEIDEAFWSALRTILAGAMTPALTKVRRPGAVALLMRSATSRGRQETTEPSPQGRPPRSFARGTALIRCSASLSLMCGNRDGVHRAGPTGDDDRVHAERHQHAGLAGARYHAWPPRGVEFGARTEGDWECQGDLKSGVKRFHLSPARVVEHGGTHVLCEARYSASH